MNKIVVVVEKTLEYDKWFDSLTDDEQTQVLKRLDRIRIEGHFGDFKHLDENLLSYAGKMDGAFILQRYHQRILC